VPEVKKGPVKKEFLTRKKKYDPNASIKKE